LTNASSSQIQSAGDQVPTKPSQPNERRCVSCRRVRSKQEFWRIVRVFPSGQVQLDQGMGRSAYICPQASCLQTAQKKNRLGRALHASVPETLYQTLWQRLAQSNSQNQT
jgi:predicted RNA-binding protein YlxR (DUF448 family)